MVGCLADGPPRQVVKKGTGPEAVWGNFQELSQFFPTESRSIPNVTEWTMC